MGMIVRMARTIRIFFLRLSLSMFPAYSKNQNLCKALKDEPFGSLLGWYSPKEKFVASSIWKEPQTPCSWRLNSSNLSIEKPRQNWVGFGRIDLLPRPFNLTLTFKHCPVDNSSPILGALIPGIIHAITAEDLSGVYITFVTWLNIQSCVLWTRNSCIGKKTGI